MRISAGGFIVAAGLAALLAWAPAWTQPTELKVVSHGPAQQYAATQYVLHSPAIGRNFLVKVTPPFSPVPPGQKRPVIYALDGGYEVAGPMGWMLGGSGAMAQAYIVSVGYLPGDFGYRDTDLAFHPKVENGKAIAAGGAVFERFLLDELRAFMTARYPVDGDRAILFGHSEGGVFAAHVLAERPEAFHGYLISSPSVSMDGALLERVAASAAKGEGRRVYVAVGGAETPAMLQNERRLVESLNGPSSRLTATSRIYDDAHHLSYYPLLIATAFPWLLPPS